MNADLQDVIALDTHDEALKKLDEQLAAAKALRPDAEQAVRDAEAALAQIKQEIRDALAESGRLNRDVNSYEQRKRGAHRALEMGSVDEDTADRQVAQVTEILDRLETEQLENMELQEALDDTLGARKGQLADAEQTLEEARAVAPPEIDRLQGLRDAEQGRRDATAAEVRRDLMIQYDLVRKRRKRAITFLDKDKACTSCMTMPPPGMIADARRGAVMVACKACRRWIVP